MWGGVAPELRAHARQHLARDPRRVAAVAADDPEHRRVGMALVEETGFTAFDAGVLADAAHRAGELGVKAGALEMRVRGLELRPALHLGCAKLSRGNDGNSHRRTARWIRWADTGRRYKEEPSR